MRKRNKITLIVLASVVLIATIFGIVDYNRTKANKKPLFAIPFLTYKDGNSLEFMGIGYKIVRCNTDVGDRSRHFGFYNINVENKCILNIEHKPLSISENDMFDYEYKPTKKGGQHIFTVNGYVSVKENASFKSFEHKSIQDIENNLGISLLKSDKIPNNYIWLMSSSGPSPYGGGFIIDYEKSDSPGVVISMSNYEDKECEFTAPLENRLECHKEWPQKTLTLSIIFLTQYAREKEISNFQIIYNDFSATEPDVEIQHIKSLGIDAYIDGYPLIENGGTGMYSIMFIYENVVYQFDGQGFTNTEIIEIIESMKF